MGLWALQNTKAKHIERNRFDLLPVNATQALVVSFKFLRFKNSISISISI